MNNNLITVIEAENEGISMDMVRICKEIRKLAKLGRITLDETIHRSGLNKHFRILVQRGMLLLPILIMGQKCENGVYIVSKREIETPIIG